MKITLASIKGHIIKLFVTKNICVDVASLEDFVFHPRKTHNMCPEHATFINNQTTKLNMNEDETLKTQKYQFGPRLIMLCFSWISYFELVKLAKNYWRQLQIGIHEIFYIEIQFRCKNFSIKTNIIVYLFLKLKMEQL